MKIAIFSDVHANLPALEAVLNDIEKRRISEIYCLGDLVDFAPWGNEVIDLIKTNRIFCLMGNHDERIVFDTPVIPLEKHSVEETVARIKAINYSKKTITKENKNFLSNLPFSLNLNYKIGSKHWQLLLVHATKESNDTYLYEDGSDEVFKDMLDDVDAVVMGHTHISFVKNFGEKWAINCGSVGRSKEANRLASYVILTLTENQIIPEVVQIPYEIGSVIKAIEESEIPNFYADFLRLSE